MKLNFNFGAANYAAEAVRSYPEIRYDRLIPARGNCGISCLPGLFPESGVRTKHVVRIAAFAF